MARRSLSDSFPSRGGKASWASLKRQVIASGVMLDYFALGAGGGGVKDCNDDNEGNRIGKGNLRVFGAF